MHFFLALSFGNLPKTTCQTIQEIVDDYFFIGGRKAFVIHENSTQTIALPEKAPLLCTALKIISYFTLIIPLFMLLAKSLFRLATTYRLDTSLSPPLANFYTRKGILPNTPLEIDLHSLDLPLDEIEPQELDIVDAWVYEEPLPLHPTTLGQAAHQVITVINQELANAKPNSPLKQRRTIRLIDNATHPHGTLNMFFYSHFFGKSTSENLPEAPSWLSRILQALVNKEHIYQIEGHDENGYIIQV